MAEFERLTIRYENGVIDVSCADYGCAIPLCDTDECPAAKAIMKRLAAYEDSGLTPERVTKLGKAEAEGKLFLLPCKVGDTVFRICGSRGRKFVAEREVVSITICSDNDIRLFTTTEDWLGRTVFSTREEAQAALERMKQDEG